MTKPLVCLALAAVVGASWANMSGSDARTRLLTMQDPVPATEIGAASAPDWRFTVYAFQDPYAGQLQEPAQPEPGTRYVGAEVEIDNSGDQALDFFSTDVKLVDGNGVEYRTGDVLGSEPRLRGRNLNPGERARGWVWYAVPDDAVLAHLVFVAPPPEFRVAVPEATP